MSSSFKQLFENEISTSTRTIFLIHRGQILFFHFELFKGKWKSKIETYREQVFVCCWVMIVTLRNIFIVFDSKLVIITSVKRWEHSVPEFEKYHCWKMKALLRVHLKLSADFVVGKLLQTTRVGSVEGSSRFSEFMGWPLVI